jgi:hypothetical protein
MARFAVLVVMTLVQEWRYKSTQVTQCYLCDLYSMHDIYQRRFLNLTWGLFSLRKDDKYTHTKNLLIIRNLQFVKYIGLPYPHKTQRCCFNIPVILANHAVTLVVGVPAQAKHVVASITAFIIDITSPITMNLLLWTSRHSYSSITHSFNHSLFLWILIHVFYTNPLSDKYWSG